MMPSSLVLADQVCEQPLASLRLALIQRVYPNSFLLEVIR